MLTQVYCRYHLGLQGNNYTLKAGSQYNAHAQCVMLRHLCIDACSNATRRQDRLGFYPSVRLCQVLVSDHQEITKICNQSFTN